MGWTKEEFKEFCARAGVNPETGLRTGVIELDEAKRRRAEGLRRWQKWSASNKRGAKTRAANKARAAQVSGAEPQQDAAKALGATALKQAQGPARPDQRIGVHITVRKLRPCDHDNCVGGLKPLIDSLRDSGLIPEDSEEAIRLEVTQERVSSKPQEGVSITLTYPP